MSGLGWKIAGGTLALGSVGWGAFNVVDLVAHEVRTEVTTYDARDVDVLDVDNSDGPVTIVGDRRARRDLGDGADQRRPARDR